MARSINTAIILGNLTRDPELRYTPAGHAVCSFGVATNRLWTTAEGERKEEAEFHNVVAWNRLAEICSQYLTKGQKVYIQGRLQTRTWEGQDGVRRSRTEIVADDMVMLQRPGGAPPPSGPEDYETGATRRSQVTPVPTPSPAPEVDGSEEVKKEETSENLPAEASAKEGQPSNQSESGGKGKEDVDPKKMPF